MKNKYNKIDVVNFSNSLVKKKNRQKIIFLILIVLLIILFFLIFNVSKCLKELKKTEEFAKQIMEYKIKYEQEQLENNKELEKLRKSKIPKVTEQGKENFKKIFNSNTKRAFLTFDDGPSSVTTQILQTLEDKNIKATFFVLGSNAEKNPNLIKDIYDRGHYIGNHGYSHIYSSIYSNPQSVIDEYNKTNDIIKKAINEPEFDSHLFRFPGGYYGGKYFEVKKQAKKILMDKNIFEIDWNCLTGDSETTKPTPEFIIKRLEETSKGKNSLVILMHDAQAKKITADMLPQIIDYLSKQGYEFKTFYDIFV